MKSCISIKIKELRKKAGMTQSELASKLGISPSAVGMYEQGRREPDNQTMLKLCSIFDTTSDFLLGKSDKPNRPTLSMEVSDVIDEFTQMLSSQQGLMFDGVPLSDDDRRKIVDAIKVAAAIAEQQHKNS
ncbi:MAG: helix-turn-helix transcriptional regulator [Acutalibacteraceae bacterium]